VSALASQAIVGIYLSEEQVGTYAIALGIIGVTGIWRSGGAATFLPSVKPSEFDDWARPALRWASTFQIATALLTVALALRTEVLPASLRAQALEGLPAVLCVLAVRSFVFPIALVGRMRLAVDHRFVGLARLDSVNAVARLAITWVAAAMGGGTLALALPYTLQSCIEAAGAIGMGGVRRSDFRPSTIPFRTVASMLAWPFALAILNSIRADISFLIIGLAIPASALGVFYFAFQMANQPTMLLASSLQNVLAPMLARDRGSKSAERDGMGRVFSGAMLFVPVTTMAAASFFPAGERLIWGGKWASATTGLYFLCVGATYATVAALLLGPLLGLQRFRAATAFEALKLVGTIGGALLGAALLPTVARGAVAATPMTVISAAVGFGITVTSLAQLFWIARRFDLPRTETIRNLLYGPALAGLTAVAAQSIGTSIVQSAGIGGGRLAAAIELTSIAVTYLLLITLAIRFTAEGTLRETVLALPPRARQVAERLFQLA
jgi:O-antigen/teichoic acid export membrane protein